ncbi:hypothetical protein [Streptomyces sp. NBC_01508]|uniref:hypothetical protein n=1 Tax=Streptomyces sp. NBC_01508 TaxID=2903888 RepID=UPI003865708B
MSGKGAGDTTPLRRRPAPLAALFVVLLMLGGVAVGALGRRPLSAVIAGLLLILLVGGCVLLVRSINRATAREIGVPRDRVSALSRCVQKENIPQGAAERAAMGLLLAKHRRTTVRAERYRWAYMVGGALFVLLAVAQFLNGAPLFGAVLLLMSLSQFCQPLVLRRTLRRLDRVTAALAAHPTEK